MLPSFNAPPLDEVVLGVQFESPPYYNSTHLAAVYELFRDQFPIVDEQQRLIPNFETFGGNARPGFQMEFGPPPLRSRTHFISKDENHLIQFQDDRLLLNWRQGNNGAQYPRFEKIVTIFEDALLKISAFFEQKFGHKLSINQSEVSYINIIKVNEFKDAGQYISFLNISGLEPESIVCNLAEIIRGDGGSAARLHQELNSVYSIDGRQRAIRFSLTVRGKPLSDTLNSSLDFLHAGHKTIVNRFCDLTTERAHHEWGRQ